MWGFDVTPRSRSRIVLIRRWATGDSRGSRLSDRRCLALAAKEAKGERERRGPKGARWALAWLARRAFPVNGERRPRASIQSGRETTLGPRVVHYSLRCPSLFPPRSSLLLATEFSPPFSSPGSPREADPLVLLPRTSIFPCFIIFYFVIVITFIIIMRWLLQASEFDDVRPSFRL